MKSIRTCLLAGAMVIIAGKVAAMEAMENSDLSEAVGQSGISVGVVLPDLDGAGVGTDLGLTAGSVIWHDKTGFTGAAAAGAIQLGSNVVGDQLQLIHSAGSMTLFDIDAGADATAHPVLNIRISSPATVLKTGNIYVSASYGIGAATTDLTKIMDSMTITSGSSITNIQLGNEIQGSMIVTSSTSVGGLNIAPFVLYDVNSGGALRIDNINIINRAGADLDIKTSWDISTTGLIVKVDQFGTVSGGADVRMTNLRFGDLTTTAIGNVEFIGVTLAGTAIRIVGKL